MIGELSKLLLPQIAKSAAPHLKRLVFGEATENELRELLRKAIASALQSYAANLPGGATSQSSIDHCSEVIFSSLIELASVMDVAEVALDQNPGSSDNFDTIAISLATASSLDPRTLSVESGGELHMLDVAEVLGVAFNTLAEEVPRSARLSESPLHEFASEVSAADTRRRLTGLEHLIGEVLRIEAPWLADEVRDTTRIDLERRLALIDGIAPSPYLAPALLTDIVADLATRSAWSARIAHAVDRVAHHLQLAGAPSLQRDFERLRIHGVPYSSLARSLTMLPFQPALSALRDHEQNASPQDRPASPSRAASAISDLYWLEEQSKTPGFDLVLPVAGRLGSGRSRFLVQASLHVMSRGWHAIWIDGGRPERPEQAFVEAAGATYGRRFSGLPQAIDFLNREASDGVLVAVDDAHLWQTEDLAMSLHGLIDRLSVCPKVRWIVTADAGRLYSLFSLEASPLWAASAIWPAGHSNQPASGWVDLDALNVHDRVGLKMLKQREGDDRLSVEYDHVMTLESGRAISVIVNTPLCAKVLDSTQGAQQRSLTDFNEHSFVEAYWVRLIANMPPRVREMTNRLARAIADIYAEDPRARLEKSELRINPYLAPVSWSDLDSTTEQLLSLGVLERLPAAVDATHDRYELRLDPLWGFRIAGHLRDLAYSAASRDSESSPFNTALVAWQSDSSKGGLLAECVLEALLVELRPTAAASRNLWQSWVQSSALPIAPLLQAAAQCGAQELRLASRALNTRKDLSHRDVFAMLRFVGWVGDSDWSLADRLGLTSRHFDAIAQLGLSAYFVDILRALLMDADVWDPSDLRDVLKSMVNSHRAGAVSKCAEVVNTAAVHRLGDPQRWLKEAGSFLAWVRRQGSDQSVRRVGELFEGAMVVAIVDWFFVEEGLAALTTLEKAGWLDGELIGFSAPVSSFTRQQIHLRCGRLLHGLHREGLSAEYLAVVERLEQCGFSRTSGLLQKISSFYLIRHSRPTGGEAGVIVSSQLWPVLELLAQDQDLVREVGAQGREMFLANGITPVAISSVRTVGARPHRRQGREKPRGPRTGHPSG